MTGALELFANQAATTLNGNITSVATSLVVTSATGFPATGNFRITIDSEIMLVTAVSGTTYTILRAQEGTTGASHTSGANIISYLTAGALAAGYEQMPQPPGGRITLDSANAVEAAAHSAITSIYYLPYINQFVPVFNGSGWTSYNIGTGVSLAFYSGAQVSAGTYDVFIAWDSVNSVYRIGTGPAWTNTTTRSSGLSLVNGIWTNTSSLTLQWGSSVGNTVTLPANQGTFVGTIYMNGGAATMTSSFIPAAAAGGGAAIVPYCNAYNQVPVGLASRDSTTSWTYATATWRKADNNANNSITFVDALGTTYVQAAYQCSAGVASLTAAMEIGLNLNSTSATPKTISYGVGSVATLADTYKTGIAEEMFAPALGVNTITAMENSPNTTSITFNPVSGTQVLVAKVMF